MAKDEIVIKKITIVQGGGHGGAWKVAAADFFTAMMAFFLVMWLLGQDAETKANVASYFSGPSMLESQFTSYGAQLTLEKLFLDLVNEPLDTLQNLLQPPDFTPDVLSMGHKGVVLHHVAESLGEIAESVDVGSDSVVFEIKDYFLFELGSSNFSGQFSDVMKQIAAVTEGLKDAEVTIESEIYSQQVEGNNADLARVVGIERAKLLRKFIEGTFENDSNTVKGKVIVKEASQLPPSGKPPGLIRFILQQKSVKSDGSQPRKIEDLFGDRKPQEDIYQDFVRRLSERKKQELLGEEPATSLR